MKSILTRVITSRTINKSLFLNHLIPVRSLEHVKKSLIAIRAEHPDANHHCYAYVLGEHQEQQKYSDDGEPSRTAGYPMLDVLLKQELTDVLTVTIRYFGGIKLGAGGLVRAYTNSVAHSIKDAQFAFMETFQLLDVSIPFDEIGHVEHILRKDYTLIHTEYTEQVLYSVEVLESNVAEFINTMNNQTNGKATISKTRIIKRYK